MIDPQFIGGVPPFEYAWNQNNTGYGNDSVITVIINQDTTIHLWVRDVCGREFYDNFEISALDVPPLVAYLPGQEALCAGSEFLLDPNRRGEDYLLWNTNGPRGKTIPPFNSLEA